MKLTTRLLALILMITATQIFALGEEPEIKLSYVQVGRSGAPILYTPHYFINGNFRIHHPTQIDLFEGQRGRLLYTILTDSQTDETNDYSYSHFNPNHWSVEGNRFVLAYERHDANVYDIKTGTYLFALEGTQGNLFKFSQDGKKLLCSSNDSSKIAVWDATNGKKLLNIPGQLSTGQFLQNESVSEVKKQADWIEQEKTIQTINLGSWVLEWDSHIGNPKLRKKNGKLIAVLNHPARIGDNWYQFDIQISPDQKTLITSSGDGDARLWFLPKAPEYSFVFDDLSSTLKLLQKTAYHQGGQNRFYKELNEILEKEVLTQEQKLVLFLMLKTYLEDPAILTKQMSEEILPSLRLSAKELAEKTGVTHFSNLKPSIPVIKTALSLLRASTLAIKESGGATVEEQPMMTQLLSTIGIAQAQFKDMQESALSTPAFCNLKDFYQKIEIYREYFSRKSQGGVTPEDQATLNECLQMMRSELAGLEHVASANVPSLFQSSVRALIHNINSVNSGTVEKWAQDQDLRATYARLFITLVKYLETI